MDVFPKSSHFAALAIGNGYWLGLSERQRAAIFLEHEGKAARILFNSHVGLPESSDLESIVEAAFKAFNMYVEAGMEHPGMDHWQAFFERFVITCQLQGLALERRSVAADNVRIPAKFGSHDAAAR